MSSQCVASRRAEARQRQGICDLTQPGGYLPCWTMTTSSYRTSWVTKYPSSRDPRVGVVYCDCWTSDGRRDLASRASIDRPPSGEVPQAIRRLNLVPACTAVWRRSLTGRLGPFAESLSSIDDRHLWIRAALAGAHFAYVEEPLAIKDTGPGRLSADKRRHETRPHRAAGPGRIGRHAKGACAVSPP